MRSLRSTLGAAAAIAVGAAFAASAAAETKVQWSYTTWGAPREWTRGIERVAAHLDEKTGGNFTLELHYGEALSPAREHLDGIAIGAFEMAPVCMSYHPGKNPIGNVMDLPFLPLADPDVQGAVYNDFNTGFEPFREEMGQWNGVPFFTALLPQYEFMGRGTPPQTIEDWRGMRVRALGGLGEAMRRLGAIPTTVTAPEVYSAVERGVIQAASWPYAYTFAAYRLYEISTWFTSNMAIGTVFCPNIINKDAYAALPDDYKALLEEGTWLAYEALKEAYAAADAKWIPVYEERMQEIRYTDEELARFREAGGEPVWDAWVAETEAKGLPGREALDFVLESAERAAARGS